MDAAGLDPAAMAALQADLVAWGVLESGVPPRLTRRGRAAMMRAAARLREEELVGAAPIGHPLVQAAALVLDAAAPEGALTQGHVNFLAAVELASLPEGVRGMFSGSGP